MRKIKIGALVFIGLILAISIITIWWYAMKINPDFAMEVLLEYHYNDINISLKIIDESDILTLKQILKERTFKDAPSCGFTTDISITMTDGNKKIIFCPANDGCPLLRIGYSNKYIKISDEARAKLNEILEKYGMIFPCV